MIRDVPAISPIEALDLCPIAVKAGTELVPPTMRCLPGLLALADEVSEKWITARRDGEVMERWLGRIIERNGAGQSARFCLHSASNCAGVVGFPSLDPVRISWWVGAQWRGTGLAESASRAALMWLGTTRALTLVEAIVKSWQLRLPGAGQSARVPRRRPDHQGSVGPWRACAAASDGAGVPTAGRGGSDSGSRVVATSWQESASRGMPCSVQAAFRGVICAKKRPETSKAA